MRIRRRPPQIPALDSTDPAAVGAGSGGVGAGLAAAVRSEVGKGETIMGTGRLHPSIEAPGKGGRPWGGDSAVGWRLGHAGGGGSDGSLTGGDSDGSCYGEVQQLNRQNGNFGAKGEEKDHKPPDAAAAAHSASGGDLHSSVAVAAANGFGAEALVVATVSVNGSCNEHGGAARKRKNIALSNVSSMLARSPSLSYVKAEISNGGVTCYMHGTADHDQVVKDDDTIKREEQQQLVASGGNINGNSNKCGKRRRSPAVLMEGSRCSRVNGRGWRCFQQTLVGYSLCEHHLGKGRLRSVSSVKCKKAAGAGGKHPRDQSVSAVQQHDKLRSLATMALDDDDDDDDYEDAKPAVEMKRRKRIGTVKARSMSSLLGQMSSDVISHAGVGRPEVAPILDTATTLAGLSAAVIRVSRENTAASASGATAAASLPVTTAAHQEGISAVVM